MPGQQLPLTFSGIAEGRFKLILLNKSGVAGDMKSRFSPPKEEEDVAMMGERTGVQEALIYEFSLERHFPLDHLLRAIDRFVDLSGIRL